MIVEEPSYPELVSVLRKLIPPRQPFTIGIDGRDGAGKSTLARYLAWRLGMPAIETDLFIVRDTSPIRHRIDDLRRLVEARHGLHRPVIVEGILLLATLQKINVRPDYRIFVENAAYGGGYGLSMEINAYFDKYRPKEECNFVVPRKSGA